MPVRRSVIRFGMIDEWRSVGLVAIDASGEDPLSALGMTGSTAEGVCEEAS